VGDGSKLTAKTMNVGGGKTTGKGSLAVSKGAEVDAVVNLNMGATFSEERGAKIKQLNDNRGKADAGPGTLDIATTYAQLGGGTLEVDIEGEMPGQFGFLDITGTADFARGTTLDFVFMGKPPDEPLTFLTADGGLNVTAASDDCEMGLFTCEFSDPTSGLRYEVQSGQESLTLIPLSTPVPEPSSIVLVGVGAALIGARARRRHLRAA
jgi:hypothetical protein